MKSKKLTLPALRAHMGDWVYYITFLQMEEIAKRVELAEDIHPSSTLKEMIQRQITDRANPIAEYLLNQSQRFFNSLIVGVYGGSPNWLELAIETNRLFDAETLPLSVQGALGFLQLDGHETLFAIDGQHRVQGIKQALKENDELKHDEVSVIFVAHRKESDGLEQTRRLFTTLNRYAKPVKKSEIIALDEDDTIAIITRKLVEEHQLFCDQFLFKTEMKPDIRLETPDIFELVKKDFILNEITLSKNVKVRVKKKDVVWLIIDYERKQTYTVRKEKNELKIYYQKISTAKTKSISRNDGNNITSIITLYDVMETILREKGKKWHDFKRYRPIPSVVSQYHEHATRFWDTMIEYLPALKEFKETPPGKSVAAQYRSESGGNLLFRPVGLEIVATVIREATDQWVSEEEAIKRVSKISMGLTDKPWDGLLWDKVNQRMLTDSPNKKVAKQLLLYNIGGDLRQINTEEEEVRKEYAGLLKKEESKVKLPKPLSLVV